MARYTASVHKVSGRKNLQCQVYDRETGEIVSRKSTGTKITREAERFAGQHVKAWNDGTYRVDSRMPICDLAEKYIAAKLKRKSDSHKRQIRKAFRRYEDAMKPKSVNKVTTESVSRFSQHLDDEELSPATIASYLKAIRLVYRWADKQGLILKCPGFELPEGATRSGGRSITTEEFERMLAACEVRRRKYADSWKFLLRGLWWSGLRISEALSFSWDADADFRMEFDGKRPMFWIAGSINKSRKDQRWPMTPDFYHFLMAVPESERVGFVFNPTSKNQLTRGGRMCLDQVESSIGKIGKTANVVTKCLEDETIVYASAHDLRRSFGTRWAKKKMLAVLKVLMRHASIETTMKFYVAQNEDQFADEIWEDEATPTDTLTDTNVPNGGSAHRNRAK